MMPLLCQSTSTLPRSGTLVLFFCLFAVPAVEASAAASVPATKQRISLGGPNVQSIMLHSPTNPSFLMRDSDMPKTAAAIGATLILNRAQHNCTPLPGIICLGTFDMHFQEGGATWSTITSPLCDGTTASPVLRNHKQDIDHSMWPWMHLLASPRWCNLETGCALWHCCSFLNSPYHIA